jgi:uncharacterized membrane protein (UPF0182 family)
MRRIGAAIGVVALLFALSSLGGLMVDWAWFASIGYARVFWTALLAKATVFGVVFAVSAALLWLNARLALRFASSPPPGVPAPLSPSFVTFTSSRGQSLRLQPSRFAVRLSILAAAIVLGLLIALGESSRWDMILRFIRQAPYGRSDPPFGRDIDFYLFSLPVYVAFKYWLYWLLAFATLVAGLIYLVHSHISLDPPRWSFSPATVGHGSALLGLFFLAKAVSFALDCWLLLYDDNGVVTGASYTDVHVELPALDLLIALAVIAAVVVFANIHLRSAVVAIAAAFMVFGVAFVLADAAPALIQRF